MLPAWITLIGSLAAALIGAIIAPQFTQAAERRAARARLCEMLMDVEVTCLEDEYGEFIKALARLEAASIVAGMPRLFVIRYIQALLDARDARFEKYDDDNREPIRVVPDELMEKVHLELRHVSQALWHPWLMRLKASLARARVGSLVP